MAEQGQPPSPAAPHLPGGRASPSPGPARRPRAPTITIDTSAGDAASSHQSPRIRPQSSHTPTELRASNSFDSRESRPTSPHNVSSPTQWQKNPQFLSVPTGRPRGQSFDLEGAEASTTSDLTYVNPTTPYSEVSSKPFGDQQTSGPDVIPDHEALQPDPGTEGDFQRENNPFAFAPGHMTKLLNPKSLGAFHAVGGLAGLEKGLRSDRSSGLSSDEQQLEGSVSFEEAILTASPASDTTLVPSEDIVRRETTKSGPSKSREGSYADRRRIFVDNHLPERRAKNIFQLAWMAYNDKVLILLTVAAVVALALGLYQTFGQPHPAGQPAVEWVEGVAIIVAIVVVVSVGALNDWQKERQFVKLNTKKDDRNVKLVRSGKTQEISIHDILVGDVLLVEPGDILPVDGIFISGHNVKCDESSATGESEILKKTPGDEVYRVIEAGEPLKKMDPFMMSGAKVTEGVGKILVTATGIHSSYGKTMMALREENEATPLQQKLNVLAEYIAKLGGAAALLLFIVLLIKFLAKLSGNHDTPSQKGQQFLNILIVAVTIVVVAVPEGLPLAVTLALAFATKQMLKDNNLVRVLRSCETMGNATTVCSDKTGTLTQNVMTVVAGTLGTSSRFSNSIAPSMDHSNPKATKVVQEEDIDNVGVAEFIKTLSPEIKALLKDSIVLNSTAFEGEEKGEPVFIGSKTETALLDFAKAYLGMESVSVERANAEITQMVPFDSGRKCMAMVIKMAPNLYRLYVKGASELMLLRCTKIVRDPTRGIDAVTMSKDNRNSLNKLIGNYANRSLRTLGFLYRDFESWPPRGAKRQVDDKTQAEFDDVCKDMTMLGITGIQDPLRPGVSDAVKDCIMAGVYPRMVTGDNVLTAKAIARECGIYTQGGVAMEGPVFRKMSKQEQREIIPKLQVLARSSPEDKRVLVKRLKEMGETVAVTGDGTNDAPALKAADVGFSMNIAGTEVAKEASDIILMDDNFESIVKALMWGRAVNDAVKKFLQFQITVNITAVTLAFVSAVASATEQSVLTAVQLLWVNLIMDTMAALALATDGPTRKILNRKPDPKSAPLITLTMWKMIIGQAVYQLVVTFILYFGGSRILSYDSPREQTQLHTLVFNTFVWMQIFNAFNNRRLDNNFNIFEGVTKNWFFMGIMCIMVGGQILIIFVGGAAFNTTLALNGAQWAYSIILGALSIPVGIIIRLIPDELIRKFVPDFLRRRSTPQVLVSDEERPFEFNQALMDIKEELAFIRKFRGGRLSHLKFTMKHPKEALLHSRSPSRSRSGSLPQTPDGEHAFDSQSQNSHSPAHPSPSSRPRRRERSRSNSAFAASAAMAGIIAGSVAGWSPAERAYGDGDSLRFSRARSKSDLSREVEIHPGTTPEDPIALKEDPVA